MPRERRNSRPSLPFDQKLVLHHWILSLFGVERFDQLADTLRDETLQGMDENHIHRFHHELCLRLPAVQRPELPDSLLLEYDQAIASVTLRLNQRRITRGEPAIVWKYYQYLALLFTEIYLDRYFRDADALARALNAYIKAYNEDFDTGDRVDALDEADDAWSQLNKLAFWMATGSGKTLLMHAHILQYQRFLEVHGKRRDLNRIILLTPNEGLSQQHLREFEAAGIAAELFNKHSGHLFAGTTVEILEITKLRDEMGETTIAVDAFEGNNLVLIDEAHRGANAGETGAWLRFRNALCEQGFSFEYSATFGQAVKGNQHLVNLYARSILMDYSYRWFYRDGFGKDYQILNLDDDSNAEWMASYLSACLLTFVQQQLIFRNQADVFRPFNLEKPLWVFVGGSVTATLTSRDASDIMDILRFFANYVSDPGASIVRIRCLLHDGLVTASGNNLFAGRFSYWNMSGLSPSEIYEETLTLLFNAPHGGALHIENLKGVSGEVALRVGDHDPFGVINVGADTRLIRLCETHGWRVDEHAFAGSLFHRINEPESSVNLLIGSKKFTEGWNSWRVSTMGLMNVGRGEGSQIIQLFGRGVRLKGYEMSLKRSTHAALPRGLTRPPQINALETLNIFGIRADYMAQFRDFLEEEGLPGPGVDMVLPLIKRLDLTRPLKTVRLKKRINGVSTMFGDAFRRLGPIPTLEIDDSIATRYFQTHPIVMNWYPKIQAMSSRGASGRDDEASLFQAHLRSGHIAFLDYDRLFFELERFKAERGWYNLNLTQPGITALLADPTWYTVLIPETELAFDSFEKVSQWQEIALALLKNYTERYYILRKREWEMPYLEYQEVTLDDPNFLDEGYHILVEESQVEIVTQLQQLQTVIETGRLKPWEFRGIKAIWFERHLYQPLLALEGHAVEISPVALNPGERRFIEDLKTYYDTHGAFFGDKDLYLLRNLSRGRGVGFFEAGNFYPDFILWLFTHDKQYVTFVDPKGMGRVGVADLKIHFYQKIKEIEARLGDSQVILNSYIVSNTASHAMQRQWGINKSEMLARHIVFQDEDRDSYVDTMIRTIVGD